MKSRPCLLLAFLLAAVPIVSSRVKADDWPQVLGPERNGISAETGLLETWPTDGPKELWRVAGGVGMSGLAVRDDRVVTMVQRDATQWVVCLDAKTGKELWTAKVGKEYRNQMGDGPRATPAITADAIYAFSGEGILLALSRDGSELWRHDVVKELGGKPAEYGMAASPLVHKDLVVVTAGLPGATVVAFDRKSGKLKWKVGDDRAGYSSPTVLTLGGLQQIVVFSGESVLGVKPDAGRLLWRHPYETEYDCNIATPISYEGKVFVAAGENHGCSLLKIEGTNDAYSVSAAWESFGSKSIMRNEWQTSILLGKHLYGFDNVGSAGPVTHFNCVDISTQKRVWQKIRFGKGNLIAADGKLYVSSFKGELILLEASPVGFKELGRKKILGRTRQAPALSNGRLFLRDAKEIVCLQVKD